MKNLTLNKNYKSTTYYSVSVSIFFGVMTLLCFMLFTAYFNGCHLSQGVARASGFEDILDDDFVEFYETEIARAPVISTLTDDYVLTIADQYSISEKRTIALLLLEDFGKRVDRPKNFDELTKMSDNKLIIYGKTLVDAFSETLKDDEKELLHEQFFLLLKNKSSKK